MPSVNVDHGEARSILDKAWNKTEDNTVLAPDRVIPCLERILDASDVTYKYILITGLLAKCVNEKAHPRALQVSSDLECSHDARRLCHDVVVGFEKSKGDLWGLSNEPFVNKPARHPEHDKSNRQLRNKKMAATLHDALEFAHAANGDQVLAILVHALRLSKVRAESQVAASVEVETSYRKVVSFVRKFLEQADGGARLVAVVGAFVKLLNEGIVVKVYPPNCSDKFAKTAGDIELFLEGKVVSAYECKQRPVTPGRAHFR
jgi:hypothetical protein